MIRLRSALLDVEHELQPEWLALPLVARGAHRALLVLASYHADGGRIAGARQWRADQWSSRVGFRPRYVLPSLEANGLIRWEGDDLIVVHYVLNHELRIRGLIAVRVPEMNAARAAYRGSGRPIAPATGRPIGVGKDRVNCAKVLRAPTSVQKPCTDPLHRALTPDPTLATRQTRVRSAPDPTLRSESASEPPGPSGKGSHSRRPPGRSSGPARPSGVLASRLEHSTSALMALPTDGPEGYERFVRMMPVVRKPRSEATAKRWRDEDMAYWARYDLEAETEEILSELERRKASELWQTPRFIPSPINFLRAAPWRQRAQRPGAVEVFEPTSWQPPAATREGLRAYLASLAEGKALS